MKRPAFLFFQDDRFTDKKIRHLKKGMHCLHLISPMAVLSNLSLCSHGSNFYLEIRFFGFPAQSIVVFRNESHCISTTFEA